MIVTTVSLMMFDVYIYIILYPPVLLSIRRRLGIDLPGNNRNKSPDRWNRKKPWLTVSIPLQPFRLVHRDLVGYPLVNIQKAMENDHL